MDINTAFPSRWLKAGDLQGRTVQVVMDHVAMESPQEGKEPKPVVYFQGKEKGLMLNKTNSQMIAEMHGSETNNWSGKMIEIRPDKTTMDGKLVDCLRVNYVASEPQQTPPPVEEHHPAPDFDDDPIPF